MTLLTEEESALALADRHILEALQRISLKKSAFRKRRETGWIRHRLGSYCAS